MPSRGVKHRQTKKRRQMWEARRASRKSGVTFQEVLVALKAKL